MNTEDIEIEAVWSSPDITALFLELCEIYIQVRNKSDYPIQIEKVECQFECENGVEPYAPYITPYLTLKPGQLSAPPIRLRFEADLALKANTNKYRIIIHYRNRNIGVFKHDPPKFFIFKSPGPGEKHFFISHKDPEDTELARWLSQFLQKLGFIGYLSEDYRRPGTDLWEEKISSAIESSIAVIILWTSRAANSPDNIYREIEIAKSFDKRLILAPDQGVNVPHTFPQGIEYCQFEKPISKSELKKLACDIEDTYRHGGYSKPKARK